MLNNNFKNWDQSFFEKTHLKFCKIYLELNRRALNSASRAELVRLPLQITLAKKALKYYSYLCNKDENTIVKHSFIMSKELALEKRKSYIFELKSFLRETACDNADTTDPMRASTISLLIRNIENNYLQFRKEELATSIKLDFYCKFNQGICSSTSVDILRNTGTRKFFMKLYISNHKLLIETGRHCRPKLP